MSGYKRSIILFSLILFIVYAELPAQTKYLGKSRTQLAYYGNNIWNPGIKAGMLFPFRNNSSDGFFLSSQAGIIFDPGSQVLLFSYHGLSYRRTRETGRDISFGLHPLGFARSFLPETYEYLDGEIEQVKLPGRFYYGPELGIGTGKHLKKSQYRLYSRLSVLTLLPYNTGAMYFINLEIGLEF